MDRLATRSLFATEQQACAALARELTPAQWELPSLCEGWSVRDVLAHAARHIHPGGWRETIEVTGKRAERREREYAEDVDALVLALETPAPSASRGWKSMTTLNTCELVIHQQDARRPTGMPRVYPETTLARCLDFSTTVLGNVGVADRLHRRGHGLRLIATDISWSSGSGPEVMGTAEALLMALAGRAVVLSELDGAGVSILAKRLGVGDVARVGETTFRN